MLCEKCGHNQATTIITKTINNTTQTTHLCAECAIKSGYSNLFGGFSLNHIMPDFEAYKGEQKTCDRCGVSFDEILRSGNIGCAECYNVFKAELMPSIENIHGKAYHLGKRPSRFRNAVEADCLLESLKKQLDIAIEAQEFENAALLRDEINRINSGNDSQTDKQQGSEH